MIIIMIIISYVYFILHKNYLVGIRTILSMLVAPSAPALHLLWSSTIRFWSSQDGKAGSLQTSPIVTFNIDIVMESQTNFIFEFSVAPYKRN